MSAEHEQPTEAPAERARAPPGRPTRSAADATDGAPPTPARSSTTSTSCSRAPARRDEYLALAQRTQADFENFRKRMARDVAAAEARGVGRLARELLPALDNLERALAAAEAGASTTPSTT